VPVAAPKAGVALAPKADVPVAAPKAGVVLLVPNADGAPVAAPLAPNVELEPPNDGRPLEGVPAPPPAPAPNEPNGDGAADPPVAPNELLANEGVVEAPAPNVGVPVALAPNADPNADGVVAPAPVPLVPNVDAPPN